jgi:hypothetical protein
MSIYTRKPVSSTPLNPHSEPVLVFYEDQFYDSWRPCLAFRPGEPKLLAESVVIDALLAKTGTLRSTVLSSC